MTTAQKLNVGAWGLSISVIALAVFVWGHSMEWHFSHFTSVSYQLFPLFGLIAFSTMWSHYIASVIRQILGLKKAVLHNYFEITSFIVLAAIVLHPSILWLQLWRDGQGLPPGSYLQHYVAPSLRWAALLGTFSLFVFLAYEFRRVFERKSWWRFVSYASDAAMLAIFLHALTLGRNLQADWFRYVWYFYGATLIACLVYIYTRKFRTHRAHQAKQV